LNSRIYLDYNSTSPLAKSVIDFLAKGDFSYANPSSIHKSGKDARRLINQVTNQIFQTFHLDPKVYDLYFHSGATEFINTFFQFKKDDAYLFSAADHKAALKQGEKCKYAYPISIDENGVLDIDQIKERIKAHLKSYPHSRVLINIQWVNSETGIIQDLSFLKEIKQENVFIHIDAVQSPGKIDDWQVLNEYADAYSYSAHKFGALKGLGFSFCKVGYPLEPLLIGGDQQAGNRAGTENPLGVMTIGLALEELKHYPRLEIRKLKDEVINLIKSNENLLLVSDPQNSNANTICFVDKHNRADGNLIKFDLQGLDISSGSACSAGSVEPSAALLAMGHEQYAQNGLRISLGPDNLEKKDLILEKLKKVIASL
tara:strand:- start:83548 stop:84660 length:1113 start_codon:yes stop_codon:yes gene_type:complete